MRFHESAIFAESATVRAVRSIADPRLKRALRRHARVASLALQAPEAYAVLGPRRQPVLTASHGRSVKDVVDLPSDIQDAFPGDAALESRDPSVALGAPIANEDGDEYGTLWVVEPNTRLWSRRDRQLLAAIASAAAEGIYLRIQSASTPVDEVPEPSASNMLPVSALLWEAPNGRLATALRNGILASVHQGLAEAGTRLPSIREVADRIGSTRYSVLQAYRTLESEGIVETRHRSGVYVASLGEAPAPHLPETARWLGRVLTESYQHKVKVPSLPGLIRRWTASTTIRCACVESSEDYRAALADEIRSQFGLDSVCVAIAPSTAELGSQPLGPDGERIISSSHIIVTTPFHAPEVGRITERLGLPLIVATLDEESSTAGARRLAAAGELVVVCVDRAFADRVLFSIPPAKRSGVRLVTADSSAELAAVDRKQPVLLTDAAKSRLVGEDFRLLAAHYPSFSSRFAERLAPLILQANLEQLRSGPSRSNASDLQPAK
ncbi:MAG: GntR family transcriptional regulator [Gemmatimonas sp.]|nr:GntR family transcriptional regulator [Gemmatimonas sp.]